MKRSVTLVALLAMTAMTVGPAQSALAAPPSTHEYDLTYADCGFDVDIGWVGLQLVRPNLVDEYSELPAIYVEVYEAEDDSWIQTADPTDVTFVGDSFEAELSLYSEATGDIVGSATVLGTLEQVGDLEFRFDEQRKEGNNLVREYQSAAPVVVTGSLEVDIEGYSNTFDLSACGGERTVGTIFRTNPAGFTNHWSSVGIGCDVTSADGWTARVAVNKVQQDGRVPPNFEVYAWAPGMIPDDEEPALVGIGDDVKTTPSGLSAEVDLWDTRSDAPDGTAVIEATFTTGAVFEYELFFEGARVGWEITTLIVEGSLTIEDIVFDLDSSCEGLLVSFDAVRHPTPSEGKGKVPANDLPGGAFTLERVSNDHTAMASPEPEVACVIDDEEFPLGKTLWYTVAGTGDTITVDTDGSDFDTVMSVYTVVDGEFVQQACVDDVAGEAYYTNLAAVELETTEGDTYYIQIGGYDAQSGLVKVAVK